MSESSAEKFLTKKERLYFEALGKYDTVKNAAQHLGIAPSTLYNWRYNLKNKYKRYRGWVNAVIAQKKRGGLVRDFLTEKQPLKKIEEEETW